MATTRNGFFLVTTNDPIVASSIYSAAKYKILHMRAMNSQDAREFFASRISLCIPQPFEPEVITLGPLHGVFLLIRQLCNEIDRQGARRFDIQRWNRIALKLHQLHEELKKFAREEAKTNIDGDDEALTRIMSLDRTLASSVHYAMERIKLKYPHNFDLLGLLACCVGDKVVPVEWLRDRPYVIPEPTYNSDTSPEATQSKLSEDEKRANSFDHDCEKLESWDLIHLHKDTAKARITGVSIWSIITVEVRECLRAQGLEQVTVESFVSFMSDRADQDRVYTGFFASMYQQLTPDLLLVLPGGGSLLDCTRLLTLASLLYGLQGDDSQASAFYRRIARCIDEVLTRGTKNKLVLSSEHRDELLEKLVVLHFCHGTQSDAEEAAKEAFSQIINPRSWRILEVQALGEHARAEAANSQRRAHDIAESSRSRHTSVPSEGTLSWVSDQSLERSGTAYRDAATQTNNAVSSNHTVPRTPSPHTAEDLQGTPRPVVRKIHKTRDFPVGTKERNDVNDLQLDMTPSSGPVTAIRDQNFPAKDPPSTPTRPERRKADLRDFSKPPIPGQFPEMQDSEIADSVANARGHSSGKTIDPLTAWEMQTGESNEESWTDWAARLVRR